MNEPMSNVEYISKNFRSRIKAVRIFVYQFDADGEDKSIKDVALAEGVILKQEELNQIKINVFN